MTLQGLLLFAGSTHGCHPVGLGAACSGRHLHVEFVHELGSVIGEHVPLSGFPS